MLEKSIAEKPDANAHAGKYRRERWDGLLAGLLVQMQECAARLHRPKVISAPTASDACALQNSQTGTTNNPC